jgi:hypothetical protein
MSQIKVRRHSCTALGILAASVMSSTALGQEALPSQAEMWRIIQEQARQLAEQRREIDALKAAALPQVRQAIITPPNLDASAQAGAETDAAAAEAQRAAASAEVQRLAAAQEAQRATAAAQEAQRSAAQALAAAQTTSTVADASAGGGWWERTSIGGYGELHYEGGSRDLLDFHRLVLFIGHEFTNRIRFFSELELEHAWSGEGRPGEVELEQAYVQLDLSDQHRLNAGIMLIPSGFLNEIHEPPTFYGVERNPVETNIIPTTWWAGGMGLSGNFGASGIAYNLMYSEGLRIPLTGANAFLVRSGRQKTANAVAKAGAISGELTYTGIPGLELAASGHYEFDISQGVGDPLTGEDVPAWLMSTNAEWRYGGLGVRALYASWWIDSEGAEAIGRDRQTGYFLEPSYRFPLNFVTFGGDPSELGFFYRYSWWDNSAGLGSLERATTEHAVGANFWPHPNVVFKLDYIFQETDAGAKTDRFNAGIGYRF